ncbi:type II secretion system protein GspL [Thermodesulfobacteriota bacterium]
MKKVIIRMGQTAPEAVSWAEVGDDGTIQLADGSLSMVAQRIGRAKAVILVPGENVLLTSVELPGGSRKHALQAVPFALEDQLADDVEDLHFAYGASGDDHRINLAVVRDSLMSSWRNMLAAAGIDPEVMIPETIALPIESGEWSVLVDSGKTIVRTGVQSGVTTDEAGLDIILSGLLRGENAPDHLCLYHCDAERLAHEALRDRIRETEGDVPVMALLAAGLDEKSCINLLQGEFGRHAEWNILWKRWRFPAVLLCVVGILYGGLLGLELYGLQREHRQLSQQMEKIYRETFPKARKVVNPRAQMESKLKSFQGRRSGNDALLRILESGGRHFTSAGGFFLQSLRYKESRLDLDFSIKDFKTLDNLKIELQKGGLGVEIQTATSKAGAVQARIQVRNSER